MSAERDVNHIVRSWLREDDHESAERLLGIVLDRLDTTPQRRSWWPARRFATMNNPLRIAVAAAAVLVVVLVGYQLLRGQSDRVGQPTAEPTPPNAPTATVQPTEFPLLPTSGPIDPGSYRMGMGPTIVVTIPAGWEAVAPDDVRKHADVSTEVALLLYPPDLRVFADACESEGADEPVGPTAQDLLDALAAQQNSLVSEPVDATLGGIPAKRLEITRPRDLDVARCSIGGLQIWVDATRTTYLAFSGGEPPAVATVYVADSPDGRLVLSLGQERDARAADIAERDAIVASIRIE